MSIKNSLSGAHLHDEPEARLQRRGERRDPVQLEAVEHRLRPGQPCFRDSGFVFRVSFGVRVSGFGLRASGFGFRGSSFEFRVSCFGLRVSGFGFGEGCCAGGSGFDARFEVKTGR